MASKYCDESKGPMWRIILYVLMLGGLILSTLAALNCQFVSFEPDSTDPLPLSEPFENVTKADVGFFRFEVLDEDNSQCQFYQLHLYTLFDNELAWQAAQMSSVLGAICLGVAFIFASVEFLCIKYFTSRFWVGLFFILATAAQGITFAVFQSQSLCASGRKCTLGTGAFLSIGAAALYFLGAVVVCTTPKPAPVFGEDRSCGDGCSFGLSSCRRGGAKDEATRGVEISDDDDSEDVGSNDEEDGLDAETRAAIAAAMAEEGDNVSDTSGEAVLVEDVKLDADEAANLAYMNDDDDDDDEEEEEEGKGRGGFLSRARFSLRKSKD